MLGGNWAKIPRKKRISYHLKYISYIPSSSSYVEPSEPQA